MSSYPPPVAASPAARLRAAMRAPLAAESWRCTMYVATSGLLGTVSFVVLIALLFIGVPTSLLALAGLPLVMAAFGLCRLLTRVESARAQIYLGASLPIRPARTGRLLSRALAGLRTRAGWLELCYGLVALPVIGWFGCALVFAAWGGALAYLLYPAYGWRMTTGDRIFWTPVGDAASTVLHVGLGLALLLAAPWLARGVAALHLTLARAMLSPADHEQLETRVGTLEDSRARMVAAADGERRRIERDLHDGAQQRIVSVAMTLGRAQNRFADDPDAARLLVGEAHAETKRALAELRDLARGIHPAILVDRGLDAALSALAASCPTPVAVHADVTPRAPQAVEAAAYFIVAEALTNVAKHAHATRVWVHAQRTGDRLMLTITDDGVGGADPSGGTGIAGLRDRVLAIDGTFLLVSPAGGVTTLTVELPCAS